MLTIASRLDVMNRLGRAMADPTRSRILMTLLDGPSYPAVLSRELELTRSNVSNHLTCLRDCGIVVAEPEGRQTRYEIADPHLAAALTAPKLGVGLAAAGADTLELRTDDDLIDALLRFMDLRQRRAGPRLRAVQSSPRPTTVLSGQTAQATA